MPQYLAVSHPLISFIQKRGGAGVIFQLPSFLPFHPLFSIPFFPYTGSERRRDAGRPEQVSLLNGLITSTGITDRTAQLNATKSQTHEK